MALRLWLPLTCSAGPARAINYLTASLQLIQHWIVGWKKKVLKIKRERERTTEGKQGGKINVCQTEKDNPDNKNRQKACYFKMSKEVSQSMGRKRKLKPIKQGRHWWALLNECSLLAKAGCHRDKRMNQALNRSREYLDVYANETHWKVEQKEIGCCEVETEDAKTFVVADKECCWSRIWWG